MSEFKQIATFNLRNLPVEDQTTVRVPAITKPLEERPTDKVPSVPTVILPAIPGAEPVFTTESYARLHVLARQSHLSKQEFTTRWLKAEWQRRMIWRDEEAGK